MVPTAKKYNSCELIIIMNTEQLHPFYSLMHISQLMLTSLFMTICSYVRHGLTNIYMDETCMNHIYSPVTVHLDAIGVSVLSRRDLRAS